MSLPISSIPTEPVTPGPSVTETEPILRFFAFGHLPPPLREVSGQFYDVAMWIVANIPRSDERTVALRKLLESKDAAVRAALP